MTTTTNITYSRIATHRSCPQKFNYSYIRKLQSDRENDHPVELIFGNWWHAIRAVNSIARGVAKKSLRYVPERLSTVDGTEKDPHLWAINIPTLEELYSEETPYLGSDLRATVFAKLRRWESTLSDSQLDLWVERVGATPYKRLSYTSDRWEEQYHKVNESEAPLAVELPWSRDLPSLAGENPHAQVHGYIDEVYLDEKRNIVVVRDHKSNKSLDNRTTVDEMMDSQLQMYAWGVTSWLKEHDLPAPKAVAYDRVRMTHPKEPKITLTGTLSKSVTDYDLHTYLDFCMGEDGQGVPFVGRKKDGSGAGVYLAEETVKQALSAPPAVAKWFVRQVTPLNKNIVLSHLRSAVDSTFDIQRTYQRAERSREAGRNLGSSCKWCPFAKLCRAEMVGGADGEYDLKDMGLAVKPDSPIR